MPLIQLVIVLVVVGVVLWVINSYIPMQATHKENFECGGGGGGDCMAIECLRIHRRPLKDSCWQVKILSIGENGEHPCMYKQGISKEVNTITLFLSFPAYLSEMFEYPAGPVVSGESFFNPQSFRDGGNDIFWTSKGDLR